VIYRATEALAAIDPTERKQLKRTQYFLFITEAVRSLAAGDFSTSKEYFKQALKLVRAHARQGELKQPNYFKNLRQLESHGLYLEGLEHFSKGEFSFACAKFESWLTINHDLAGDLKHANIKFGCLISQLLDMMAAGRATAEQWRKTKRFVKVAYLPISARLLLGKLDLVRIQLRSAKSEESSASTSKFLLEVSSLWPLLVPDVPVDGRALDEIEEEDLVLPSFLNLVPHLIEEDDPWESLLEQNIRHALLLKADYELRRSQIEGRMLERDAAKAIENIEAMSEGELADLVCDCLKLRHLEHFHEFRAAAESLAEFHTAKLSHDFQSAVESHDAFLTRLRSLPHVVHVEEATLADTTDLTQPDEGMEPTLYTARRLWTGYPKTLRLSQPKWLKVGFYYYLRPGWNLRKNIRYDKSDELFIESRLPEWLDVFFQGASGRVGVSRDGFLHWIAQMPRDKRLLACRLLSKFRFFGVDDVREMWVRIYREKLPPEAKTEHVAYCGLGHTGKSGSLTLYYLHHAISAIAAVEMSFETKSAFRPLSDFTAGGEPFPTAVVFVDDFIGSGKQATREIHRFLEQAPWLRERRIYYCALLGFSDGIARIRDEFRSFDISVTVGETLRDADRAFSIHNGIWQSEKERKEGQSWAEDIGLQLVTGRYENPEKHCLGWDDSQALMAFHYNTPNNTLPLFWSTGNVNDKPWTPLVTRIE
jgi:hypothetical protein